MSDGAFYTLLTSAIVWACIDIVFYRRYLRTVKERDALLARSAEKLANSKKRAW